MKPLAAGGFARRCGRAVMPPVLLLMERRGDQAFQALLAKATV